MSDVIGSHWNQADIEEYGEEFLGHIDRLGFEDRGYLVTKILTDLSNVEGRLLFQIGGVFREAKDKRNLMELLVSGSLYRSLKTFNGKGSSQILALWKEANDLHVERWCPDDPGIVRSAQAAFELLMKLHELHPVVHSNWGKGHKEEAIFKLEVKLLRFIQERLGPRHLESENRTVIARHEDLQPLIIMLDLFTALQQKQFAIHLDTDEVGKTAREVIQDLLVNGPEETLLKVWGEEGLTSVDEGLITAAFLKRYGAERIINCFVVHHGETSA